MSLIPWHDSLWAHHAVVSHYGQSLGQLVSEYTDAAPWKLLLKKKDFEMTGDELCDYNGKDCRLTALVWQRMQGDLERERCVYEHDLALAEMCADLQRVGVKLDLSRQRLLSVRLGREADRYRREMRKLLEWPKFQPNKPAHVEKALFEILGVRKIKFSERTGKASADKTVIAAMQQVEGRVGAFALLLAKRREALKVKSTYVDLPTQKTKKHPDSFYYSVKGEPRRVHYEWGPRESRDKGTSGGFPVSGRLASRIQSTPRYNPRNTPDRAREMFVAKRGYEFCYFDVKQGEPRVAAFLSGDPERILVCQGDIHANNAKLMFPDIAAKGWLDGEAMKDPARGKPCRDLAKNMGLAIDYFAEAERVHSYLSQNRFGPDGKVLYGLPSLQGVQVIISKIRFKFRKYVAFVEANLAKVRKQGWMRDPVLGRIRWLGWFPSITDVANYPIQSCLAAVMNLRTLVLQRADSFVRWAKRWPGILERVGLESDPAKWPKLPPNVKLVMQIHDATIYECPRALTKEVHAINADLWSRKVALSGGELVLPIDQKTANRWSEL
jgi:hypothetical protein